MFRKFRFATAALCLSLVLAPEAMLRAEEAGATGPVAAAPAEGELYVAGVYTGRFGHAAKLVGPPVAVILDRPGIATTLALSSSDPVVWDVSLTPGTPAPRILLSQRDNGDRRSSVIMAGEPAEVEWRDLLLSSGKEGALFRALVTRLPAELGFEKLADFQGSYHAQEEPFIFDGPSDDPRLDADYLASVAWPDAVPDALKSLAFSREIPRPDVDFTAGGFFSKDRFSYLSAAGGKVVIPVPTERSGIYLLSRPARDPETDRVFVATYWGDRYIYVWHPEKNLWSAIRADRPGLTGVVYDSKTKTLFAAARSFSEREKLGFFWLDEHGKVIATQRLPFDAFPGLGDLYDSGNGPPPALIVLGIADGKALLRSVSERYRPFIWPESEAGVPWRSYVLDQETLEVVLVAYEN